MSTKLENKSIGSIVKLKVGGTAKNFIVVNQGKPSSLYDNSCNGTWLLMQDIYENKAWDSTDNDYAKSDVHTYLNGTFINLFDADIKSAIVQVKIPYHKGTGSSGSVKSGANGLSTKIFLLSGYEMGWTTGDCEDFPIDGAAISYFNGAANSKRVAKLNGTAANWWLRSPGANYTGYVFYVLSNGDWCNYSYNGAYGVRPALVLPSSLSVSDDGTVTTNTAPTIPASITIPPNIMGGSTVNVSWGTSTDDDGNLAGYIVERSTDGGSSWAQIYQGPATSTTNNVAAGTTSVMYRVKAYDDDGASSGWKTSAQVNVVNNTAPSTPSSISVPTAVRGGKTLVVTWGSSTDPEDNLSGYKLERQVDSGSWTQIYAGSAQTYTDSITKGWNTVAYRVKAYDAYNAESGYATSATRTVDNNSEPVITCGYSNNADLGIKTSDFSISYSVDDADTSDTVTVKEVMDGVQKRSFTATKGVANNFNVTGDYFQKLLNGTHTMKITASDGKVETSLTLTFTKKVTSASITLSTPMDADAQITICAITVTGSIPADANFTVEVTNNAKDTSPVWENCTNEAKQERNFMFANTQATNGFSFNFRVQAEEGPSNIGGYITSIQGGFQ